MQATKDKIAAGLERAFAAGGFAEPSVDDLRQAAGVSLRTLYKYTPSRDEMTYLALEHRHQRYLAFVFGDVATPLSQSIIVTLDRISDWMRAEASHGCLFHAAVASSPNDKTLRTLLKRHKTEVAHLSARRADMLQWEDEILLLIEGLTQGWPLVGETASIAAKRMTALLQN